MKIFSTKRKSASVLAIIAALLIAAPSCFLSGGKLSVSADSDESGYVKMNTFAPKFNYVKIGGSNFDTERYSASAVASDGLDKFISESEITVTSFTEEENSKRLNFTIYDASSWDISSIKEGTDAYLSFWIKPTKDLTFTMELQTPSWKNALKSGAHPADTVRGGEWTEIRIYRNEISDDTDLSSMKTLKMNITAGGIAADEPIRFGEIAVYSKINPYNNLYSKVGEYSESGNNAQDYASGTFEAGLSAGVRSYTVIDEKFYDKLGYMQAFMPTGWANRDISAVGSDGYLKFKVKSPHSINFLIALRDNSTKYAYAVVSTTDSTDWQDIIVPVKSLQYNKGINDFGKIVQVRVYPLATSLANDSNNTPKGITGAEAAKLFLKVGETVSFGGMEIYKKLAGDVNNDYNINSVDLINIRQLLLGTDDSFYDRADVNSDDAVDIRDLIALKKTTAILMS